MTAKFILYTLIWLSGGVPTLSHTSFNTIEACRNAEANLLAKVGEAKTAVEPISPDWHIATWCIQDLVPDAQYIMPKQPSVQP